MNIEEEKKLVEWLVKQGIDFFLSMCILHEMNKGKGFSEAYMEVMLSKESKSNEEKDFPNLEKLKINLEKMDSYDLISIYKDFNNHSYSCYYFSVELFGLSYEIKKGRPIKSSQRIQLSREMNLFLEYLYELKELKWLARFQ